MARREPCPTCHGGGEILVEERKADPVDNGDETVTQTWQQCATCRGSGTVEVDDDEDDEDDDGRDGRRR